MDAIICDISAWEYWRTPPALRNVEIPVDIARAKKPDGLGLEWLSEIPRLNTVSGRRESRKALTPAACLYRALPCVPPSDWNSVFPIPRLTAFPQVNSYFSLACKSDAAIGNPWTRSFVTYLPGSTVARRQPCVMSKFQSTSPAQKSPTASGWNGSKRYRA